MDINKFNMYSILAMSENKNINDFQNTLSLIEKFQNINNFEDAQIYLKNTWNISDNISSYKLSSGILLDVKQTADFLSIKFVYNNENTNYFYSK